MRPAQSMEGFAVRLDPASGLPLRLNLSTGSACHAITGTARPKERPAQARSPRPNRDCGPSHQAAFPRSPTIGKRRRSAAAETKPRPWGFTTTSTASKGGTTRHSPAKGAGWPVKRTKARSVTHDLGRMPSESRDRFDRSAPTSCLATADATHATAPHAPRHHRGDRIGCRIAVNGDAIRCSEPSNRSQKQVQG